MARNEAMFDTVFGKLKSIMQEFENGMVVKADKAGDYYLDTRSVDKHKKPIFFGAVKVNKNYVSYHFMPVYMFPDLLDGISDELRKRMQGKACFNFTKVDNTLFEELAWLTRQGAERIKQAQTA